MANIGNRNWMQCSIVMCVLALCTQRMYEYKWYLMGHGSSTVAIMVAVAVAVVVHAGQQQQQQQQQQTPLTIAATIIFASAFTLILIESIKFVKLVLLPKRIPGWPQHQVRLQSSSE